MAWSGGGPGDAPVWRCLHVESPWAGSASCPAAPTWIKCFISLGLSNTLLSLWGQPWKNSRPTPPPPPKTGSLRGCKFTAEAEGQGLPLNLSPTLCTHRGPLLGQEDEGIRGEARAGVTPRIPGSAQRQALLAELWDRLTWGRPGAIGPSASSGLPGTFLWSQHPVGCGSRAWNPNPASSGPQFPLL